MGNPHESPVQAKKRRKYQGVARKPEVQDAARKPRIGPGVATLDASRASAFRRAEDAGWGGDGGQSDLAFDAGGLFEGGTVEAQAEVLQRLDGTQRQKAIQRIAKVQGNQHVQRVVAAYGGNGAGRVQTKLEVGRPDDVYEQEADTVAEQVMRMPAPLPPPPAEEASEQPHSPTVSRLSIPMSSPHSMGDGLAARSEDVESYEEEEEPAEAERLSLAAAPPPPPDGEGGGNGAPSVSAEMEGRIGQLKGSGSPLPPSEREFFEPRFGVDFSNVRVHTGETAVQTAQDLSARAYTVGSDIAFGTGEYAPGTERGRRLMAHELTHVVQQGGVRRLQREPEKTPLPDIPEGGGEPLAEEVRGPFEQVLEQPLGHVVIHTGPEADEAARKMGTQAFTVGTHIYFAEGFFQPGTPEGDRLLAHELLHILQQGSGQASGAAKDTPVSSPDEPLEREAYENEDTIVERLAQLRGEDPARARSAGGPPPVSLLEEREPKEDEQTSQEKAVQAELSKPEGVGDQLSDQPGEQKAPEERSEAPPVEQKVLESGEAGGRAADTLASTEVVTGEPAPVSAPAPERTVQGSKSATIEPPELVPPDPATLASPAASAAIAQPLEVVPLTPEDSMALQGEDGTDLAKSEAGAIEAASRAAVDGVNTAGQMAIANVQNEVTRLIGQVYAESEQAKASIEAAYAEQEAAVQNQAASTIAEIEAEQASRLSAIEELAGSERERFTSAYEAQRAEAVAFVAGLREEILAAGESEAQRVLDGSEKRATTIMGEAGGRSFGGDADLVEAQRKSVHDIAQKAADECRTTGRDMAAQVRSDAKEQAQQYDQPLQDYLAQLETSYTETSQAVDEIVASTKQQIESAAQQAGQSVTETEEQGLATLENERTTDLQEVDAWVTQTVSQIEQGGTQLVAAVEPQMASFSSQISAYGANAAAQLRSVERPVASDVAAFAAGVRQDLQSNQQNALSALSEWGSGAFTELNAAFDGQRQTLATLVEGCCDGARTIGEGLVEAIQEASVTVATGLDTLFGEFQTELSASIDGALDEMKSADEKFRADLRVPHQEALEALARKVDDALASEDNILANARGKMASAVSEISSKYQSLKAEADAKNAQEQGQPQGRVYRFLGDLWNAFMGWVESVKQWFKKAFGDFWGGLLFGIISTLVVVLIGAAIIALIALVSSVAAVVVAVVLLVAAIGLMIYSRFQEFKLAHGGQGPNFWQGVGLVLLGIVDITGIPFIIEGIVGKTATGLELSGFDRGARIGSGVVMLATCIFQSVKQIRALRAAPESGYTPPHNQSPYSQEAWLEYFNWKYGPENVTLETPWRGPGPVPPNACPSNPYRAHHRGPNSANQEAQQQTIGDKLYAELTSEGKNVEIRYDQQAYSADGKPVYNPDGGRVYADVQAFDAETGKPLSLPYEIEWNPANWAIKDINYGDTHYEQWLYERP